MPNLIIIDDDPLFAGLLAEVATFSGYEAVVVSDLRQFSEAYEKTSYDVMTLDISMPDIDGFEMIDKLVNLKCRSQIVIISGHDEALMNSAKMYAKEKGLNLRESFARKRHKSKKMRS